MKIKPQEITVAGVGIELANTGKTGSSSMLYFDKSVAFALSVGRLEQGRYRQDICFVDRDSNTLASMRLRGGSSSTACSTQEYFGDSVFSKDRTNNFAGFNKHILKLAAPGPLEEPQPGEEHDGSLYNKLTDEDIEHIAKVIKSTIARADLTVVVSGSLLVVHHLLTQFPEIAEVLYPTVSVDTKGLTVASKMENFPPHCAEVGFKANKVSAIRPLNDQDVNSIKVAHSKSGWSNCIEELGRLSKNKNIPVDFLQLFRVWNAGLDVRPQDREKLKTEANERVWEAISKAWSDEVKSKYEDANGEQIKGINLQFAFNSLLGSPLDNWVHGAHVQGKMLGALLSTRMMLTKEPPKNPFLPKE